MFVDPLFGDDIGHYHGLFCGHCSAFYPFGKMVLHHNNVLIPRNQSTTNRGPPLAIGCWLLLLFS